MNWQLIPKSGISLGQINITFNDSWQDVCQKLHLQNTHKVIGDVANKIIDNILGTEASIKFNFNESLSEIIFFYGNIYYEDIQLIGSDGDIVIQQLINRDMKVFYDSTLAYICPELSIYFSINEDIGTEGTEINHIGIYPSLDTWVLSPKVYEVTKLEID
jgi:hypothetical protein